MRVVIIFLILIGGICSNLYADVQDPYDPLEPSSLDSSDADQDINKSAQELIAEARTLLIDNRPLDARTKLLRALNKDPNEYHAHILLGHYYMEHVNHFRLSMKYFKQAQMLFEKQYGLPPYQDANAQNDHAQLLYYLSQARLNLDNYQGSLELLDEFKKYYYFAEWYPASRAWVLMKLGRVKEAIREARIGVLAGAEPGRTLNILGILLSMSGERQASLEVFNDAILYELSLGSEMGQPATPLNNSGEVYKELFDEDKAISSFLKATRLPDGCEHVLPSLNLALIYIDQLNFKGASEVIDNFETCNKINNPLRNGEEHRALVHLARGRIALLTGHIKEAREHLEAALEKRQWFGKIGTDEDDLLVAILTSLAQTLQVENQHISFTRFSSYRDSLLSIITRIKNRGRVWWLQRRAKQVLTEDLSQFEDLYIKHTDSLLEYPTLGDLTASFPTKSLKRSIDEELKNDNRVEAKVYYSAYLAQNYLYNSNNKKGMKLLEQVIQNCREKNDDLLRVQALTLKLTQLRRDSDEYKKLSGQIYSLAPAELRNKGLLLVLNSKGLSQQALNELESSAFRIDNTSKLEYSIEYSQDEKDHVLSFSSANAKAGALSVRSENLKEAVNKLTDEVFSQ